MRVFPGASLGPYIVGVDHEFFGFGSYHGQTLPSHSTHNVSKLWQFGISGMLEVLC